MIGGSNASNLQGGGTTWRLAAAMLAALITLLVIAPSGDALACPPGTKSHHATTKHKAKAVTVSAHVVSMSNRSVAQNSTSIGHCCGGTSSSAGSSCKASCCSAGIADVNLDGVPFFAIPISYLSCRQGEFSSLAPASHFRPPQQTI